MQCDCIPADHTTTRTCHDGLYPQTRAKMNFPFLIIFWGVRYIFIATINEYCLVCQFGFNANNCDEIHHFLECSQYYFLIKEFAVWIKVLQKGKVSKTLAFVVTEAEKFILKATELKKPQKVLWNSHNGPWNWKTRARATGGKKKCPAEVRVYKQKCRFFVQVLELEVWRNWSSHAQEQ